MKEFIITITPLVIFSIGFIFDIKGFIIAGAISLSFLVLILILEFLAYLASKFK